MSISVSDPVRQAIAALSADEKIQKALAFLKQDAANTLEELKELVQVASPTFAEQKARAPLYKAKLEKYGAEDCSEDEIGNVRGFVNGSAPRPKVMFDAHLDTVFGPDVPLTITEKDGVFNCPGMSDDTAGLAMNLSILRAIRHAGLVPCGRLMITGTVRHEGEGDLQGVRKVFEDDRDIDACVCLETLDKPGAIINTAIGVYRYEMVFTGKGGHSWLEFGMPNPIQALCRAGAALSELAPPTEPKTTFNLGTVTGGTTVNSIPAECRAKIDIRSVDPKVLDRIDAQIKEIVHAAVAAENARWNGQPITVEFRRIGNRPAGHAGEEETLIQALWQATEAVGLKPFFWPPLGTNANIPMSLGVPATGLGGGGLGGNLHSTAEWYSHEHAAEHAGRLLLALFAMAGLEGVTKPLSTLMDR
ncbi:MAG: M20/M25/M40 family metallo-hydrolase [Rhodospirillaceae bacterium]